MKIAILTDTHFGIRNDNTAFHLASEKFFSRTFFPKLKEEGITSVWHLGDLVDSRKYIDFRTLEALYSHFLDPIEDFDFSIIAGNHDVYYKDTNKLNALELLLHKKAKIYTEAQDVLVGGIKTFLLPWINEENYHVSMQKVAETHSTMCFGHLEINGFKMDSGMSCEHGLDPVKFKKFDLTLSGHFHTPSSSGSITYLGATGAYTWADYGTPRGFHIMDTDYPSELQFIENPFNVFRKYVYDDSTQELEEAIFDDVKSIREGRIAYNDVYVQIVIRKMHNAYLYNSLVDSIKASKPLKVTIDNQIEDVSEDSSEDEVTEIKEAVDNTSKHIISYVKEMNLGTRSDPIIRTLDSIYKEALEIEKIGE